MVGLFECLYYRLSLLRFHLLRFVEAVSVGRCLDALAALEAREHFERGVEVDRLGGGVLVFRAERSVEVVKLVFIFEDIGSDVRVRLGDMLSGLFFAESEIDVVHFVAGLAGITLGRPVILEVLVEDNCHLYLFIALLLHRQLLAFREAASFHPLCAAVGLDVSVGDSAVVFHAFLLEEREVIGVVFDDAGVEAVALKALAVKELGV